MRRAALALVAGALCRLTDCVPGRIRLGDSCASPLWARAAVSYPTTATVSLKVMLAL